MNRQVILPGSKKSKTFEQTTSDYMVKKKSGIKWLYLYLRLQLSVRNTNFQSHITRSINIPNPIYIFINTYLQSNKFMVYFQSSGMFLNTYTHVKKLFSCCFPSLEIKISVCYHSILYKVQTPWHFRSCKSDTAVNCKKKTALQHVQSTQQIPGFMSVKSSNNQK